MKYQILRWRICGKWVWEIIELPEKIGKAYWTTYLKPLESPSIITKISEWFKGLSKWKNKALNPNKVHKKHG